MPNTDILLVSYLPSNPSPPNPQTNHTKPPVRSRCRHHRRPISVPHRHDQNTTPKPQSPTPTPIPGSLPRPRSHRSSNRSLQRLFLHRLRIRAITSPHASFKQCLFLRLRRNLFLCNNHPGRGTETKFSSPNPRTRGCKYHHHGVQESEIYAGFMEWLWSACGEEFTVYCVAVSVF